MISLIIRFLFACLGGGETLMVDVYIALIINGRRAFSQVPVQLQLNVKDELNALGLDTDGKPLQLTA